ncbi:putative bifunctional diguanylate cyclase/phosphodiesterase [Terasakiella sp.]
MSWQEFEDTQKEVGFLLQSELQKDGSTLDLTCDGNWMLSANTHMHQGGYAVVRVDLTEQKRTQDQLQLAATVFQTASEAMMVTDKDDIIQMVNPAFSKITGYSEREVLGHSPTLLSSGHHNAAYYKKMYLDLQNTGTWQGEIWNRRKSGEIYPEWLSISTIYDDDGEVLQRVSLFTDITSRKKSEERIHYQANYDSLTDLPNRNLFKERLNHAINMARRSKDRVALLFLDLDNFKHINDTLGHLLGDELLRQVAERLRSLFRESDTIARLSGDEFVIIINEANYDPDLQHLLTRLLECLSLPYALDGNTAYTSVSVGATFFPDDAQSGDNLLKNADAAMFKAKEMGRNTYSFFTPEMNNRAQERHTLEVALHKALDKKHFLLHYQPIVDPHTQTVVSTEALVRWNDPEKGLISPDKFIPVAEDTGLIVPMGEWILRQACTDAAHWQKEEGFNIGVSVNLSSRQFMRSDIYGLVKDVLKESQLPASKLTLEITESLLVEDENEILKTLRKLRDLGVLLSIDDFGTGYSSLSYLKRFPITTLKIDRSFICDILSDSEDSALTQAILSMAKSMNLKVVAEGVENAGQAEYLKERQCDLIQGFYYSKPLALEDLLHLFKQKKLSA